MVLIGNAKQACVREKWSAVETRLTRPAAAALVLASIPLAPVQRLENPNIERPQYYLLLLLQSQRLLPMLV